MSRKTPHLRGGTIVLLGLVLAFLVPAVTSPSKAYASGEGIGSMEWQFLDLANGERSANGLPPLQLNPDASDVAEAWSAHMAATSTLSHRPDLAAQLSAIDPGWTTIGENVGYGPSVSTLHTAFMNSPPHRANVLNGHYNYVGIGAVVASSGTIWVTFDFIASPVPLPVADRAGLVSLAAVRGDGTLTASPAIVARGDTGRRDAFVRGTDGGVWWSVAPSGTFLPWTPMGAPPGGESGDPAALSLAPGRIDVFVAGNDGRLWQRFTTNGGATWSSWLKPVGDDGTLGSAPSVSSWGGGRLDVVVTGTDGRVYQRFYDGSQWNTSWLPLGAPTGGSNGAPAAASWAPGRLDIFTRGSDNHLWQRFWDGSAWSSWFPPLGANGTMSAPPAVTTSASGWLAVTVRGTDGGVYLANYSNGWTPWTRLGGSSAVIKGRPSAASPNPGEVDVAGWGNDNRAYLFVYDT